MVLESRKKGVGFHLCSVNNNVDVSNNNSRDQSAINYCIIGRHICALLGKGCSGEDSDINSNRNNNESRGEHRRGGKA